MSTSPTSLVIPGRNCANTVRQCLSAVVPLLEGPCLREIIFVNDGSTDETAALVAEFPVTCLDSLGRGAAAARNTGWRAAAQPFIWFIDSDCVAAPDALQRLAPHFDNPKVGGVGGSYAIMNPGSLLPCLIHEEIIERHRTMPERVDFLAGFNVIYRRAALEQVKGFNEHYQGASAEDADLSFRVMAAGYDLHFEPESRVAHYHRARWRDYLRSQRRHGYWRVWLHLSHTGHTGGDSYSGWVDHIQPPLAMLVIVTSPLAFFGRFALVPGLLLTLLLLAQVPMTARLLRRLRQPRFICYAAMSFVRAFWRGIGMVHGILGYLAASPRRAREGHR